jgi:hypothetical protein
MRKSTRERKSRQFYRPDEALSTLLEEVTRSSSDEGSDDERSKVPGKKRAKVATITNESRRGSGGTTPETSIALRPETAATSAKKPPGQSALESCLSYEGQRCRLFDAVVNSKDVDGEVRSIVSVFSRNKVAAVTEIINFVLLCAGAHKKWVGPRVELEGLQPDELNELLRDMVQYMSERNTAFFPLSGAGGKVGEAIKANFEKVWEEFVGSLLSWTTGVSTALSKAGGEPFECLETVVNVLISLSSFSVTSVRDTVTESAMSIGLHVNKFIVETRNKLDLTTRQLTAEKSKERGSKTSPKYGAIQSTVSELETNIENYEGLITVIFNAVFAHRYKDFNETIRAHCIRRLGQWILQDPARLLENTYLKYLGWLCSDRCNEVRLEAVKTVALVCDVSVHHFLYCLDLSLSKCFHKES